MSGGADPPAVVLALLKSVREYVDLSEERARPEDRLGVAAMRRHLDALEAEADSMVRRREASRT